MATTILSQRIHTAETGGHARPAGADDHAQPNQPFTGDRVMGKEQSEFLDVVAPREQEGALQAGTDTLQPREYLQWLLLLERASNLPEGTRAYLVTKGPNGIQTRAVGMHDSVLNLRTDIKKHLADIGYSVEFFEDLRDYCNKRLQEAKRDVPPNARLCALALEASYEVEAAARIVLERMEASPGDRPLRTLLLRIIKLAETQMSALDGSGDLSEEEMAEIIEH